MTSISVRDVRAILSPAELAAARANVATAPPLSAEQSSVLRGILQPAVRNLTTRQPNTPDSTG